MKRTFVTPMLLLIGTLGVAAAADRPQSAEWDGLQKKKVKGIDYAFVRPGVDLAAYGKVMLDPMQVSFAKDWTVLLGGNEYVVSQPDRDRIKKNLTDLAAKSFAETLSAKDGYPIVTEAGPDVMRVSIALTDVYVNAPHFPGAARIQSTVDNAGSITLVMELRDSETGAIFARVIDQREARDNMGPASNLDTNTTETRYMVSQWAKILRKRLDAVRANK